MSEFFLLDLSVRVSSQTETEERYRQIGQEDHLRDYRQMMRRYRRSRRRLFNRIKHQIKAHHIHQIKVSKPHHIHRIKVSKPCHIHCMWGEDKETEGEMNHIETSKTNLTVRKMKIEHVIFAMQLCCRVKLYIHVYYVSISSIKPVLDNGLCIIGISHVLCARATFIQSPRPNTPPPPIDLENINLLSPSFELIESSPSILD